MKRRDMLRGLLVGGAVPWLAENEVRAWTPPESSKTFIPNPVPHEYREVARLKNIEHARQLGGAPWRETFISGYKPGHVWYNLNEYPARPLRQPGPADWARFDEYRANGVDIVKIHNEWTDWLEIMGGDFHNACDPESWGRFIDGAHQRNLEVHCYTSTGWIDHRSSDFRPEWVSMPMRLDECYWRVHRCSLRSPGWRAYLLGKLDGILDKWNVDGFYNDPGYDRPFGWDHTKQIPMTDAFTVEPGDDASYEDMLGQVKAMLARRRPATGTFTQFKPPPTKNQYYDYIYYGEAQKDIRLMINEMKEWKPYALVIPDMRLGKLNPRAVYAAGMPYLIFSTLYHGEPITGERALSPGVDYMDPKTDYWQRTMTTIADLRKKDPSTPPTYGWWDTVPGDPNNKPTYYHFLKIWKRLTGDGTRALLDCPAERLIPEKAHDKELIVSLFANQDLYAVVANHGRAEKKFSLTIPARDSKDGKQVRPGETISLKPLDLRLLTIS
jgi:hypothetical protein